MAATRSTHIRHDQYFSCSSFILFVGLIRSMQKLLFANNISSKNRKTGKMA